MRPGDRIEGIVTDAGTVGDESDPELVVFLRPWQDASGNVQKKELRVLIPTPTLRAARSAAGRWAGRSIQLTVDKAIPPGSNTLETAIATRLRSAQPAARVMETAKRQAEPRSFRNKELGRLELDRSLSALVGRRRTPRGGYEVLISVSEPDDDARIAKELERGARLALELEGQLTRVRTAISHELVVTYNDHWRQSGPRLGQIAFGRKLTLETVDFAARRVTLYFRCSLFGGHGVEVRMSPGLQIREVLLSG